jgi:D-glycero-D-manno-heptose 1,7-bisphosphate phosphatase
MSDPTPRAVFLDRDDTLIRNIPYLGDPAMVELLPGVADGLGALRNAGFRLYLVSNQSGVGRGLITKAQVAAVNAEMERRIGLSLDGAYLCYADPADPYAADERKPSPTLLFRARDEHGLDLARSFIIGDKKIDIECGRNAGCQGSILVRTGTEPAAVEGAEALSDFTAPTFAQAADWILRQP